jgi:hypothetical protein
MNKIYQPIVKTKASFFVDFLESEGFFKELGIDNKIFAYEFFCEKLTEKFIDGSIHNDNNEIFTDDELNTIMNNIITQSVLDELKEMKLIDSYIDKDGNEKFYALKNKLI